MSSTALFRQEALSARRHAFTGAVVLRPPLSFSVWAFIAATLAVAVFVFLFVGTYTQRMRVMGITAPAAGVIKLMAPQPGVVVERRVQEGQQVKAGEVLYLLSDERMTADGAGTTGVQSAVLDQLRRRRNSLFEERQRQRLMLAQQRQTLEQRLTGLHAEAAQLQRELATQQKRVESLQAQKQRFDELAQQQFMSALGVAQKEEELLEQTAKLQALQRAQLTLQREAASTDADLQQLPLRTAQQQAEVERAATVVSQDVAHAEASRHSISNPLM